MSLHFLKHSVTDFAKKLTLIRWFGRAGLLKVCLVLCFTLNMNW